MVILRDKLGHFLPGVSGNPLGGPKLKVSLTKLLQERLENEPDTASAIVNAWVEACKARDMRAVTEMLDRLEGKVSTEVNLRALIVHVGDDYAKEGLEAVKREILERKERYLLTEGVEESTNMGN